MTLRTPDSNGYYVAQTLDSNGYKQHAGSIVPWGRVGYPFTAGVVETFGDNAYHDVKRMIDDCIFAEQQAISGKSLALGFGDYTAQGIHQLQWYAWLFAQAAGLQTNVYTCDAAGTGARGLPTAVRNNLTSWLGKGAPDYNSAAVFAGAATIAADVYLGSAVINDGVAGSGSSPYKNYWTSLLPKRGAWAFNWCSSGNQFVENLIRRGGAAGIGPVQEPYTIGIPEDASVMSIALKGYSLAEILYHCCLPGWAMTAYGDPLYRPFPALGLSDGIHQTLAHVTPLRNAAVTLSNRAVTAINKSRVLANATPQRVATWQS